MLLSVYVCVCCVAQADPKNCYSAKFTVKPKREMAPPNQKLASSVIGKVSGATLLQTEVLAGAQSYMFRPAAAARPTHPPPVVCAYAGQTLQVDIEIGVEKTAAASAATLSSAAAEVADFIAATGAPSVVGAWQAACLNSPLTVTARVFASATPILDTQPLFLPDSAARERTAGLQVVGCGLDGNDATSAAVTASIASSGPTSAPNEASSSSATVFKLVADIALPHTDVTADAATPQGITAGSDGWFWLCCVYRSAAVASSLATLMLPVRIRRAVDVTCRFAAAGTHQPAALVAVLCRNATPFRVALAHTALRLLPSSGLSAFGGCGSGGCRGGGGLSAAVPLDEADAGGLGQGYGGEEADAAFDWGEDCASLSTAASGGAGDAGWDARAVAAPERAPLLQPGESFSLVFQRAGRDTFRWGPPPAVAADAVSSSVLPAARYLFTARCAVHQDGEIPLGVSHVTFAG
jgi:hypothetical protein